MNDCCGLSKAGRSSRQEGAPTEHIHGSTAAREHMALHLTHPESKSAHIAMPKLVGTSIKIE